MNSVVLADPEHLVIVDPGVLPSELDDLARATPAAAAVSLVFTHSDWDHVLGRPWWPAAETLAHDRFAAEARERRDAIRAAADDAARAHGERWQRPFEPFRPDHEVSGLRFLRLGPWRLALRDAPGHVAGMLSLHLPDRRVLIAGDMLSDLEIPLIDHSLAAYRRTLAELEPLALGGAVEVLIPGHGSPAVGGDAVAARFAADLGYLEALARRVEAARARGLSLARAEEELSAVEDPAGREGMAAAHRDNLRVAWGEAGEPAGGRSGDGRARASNGRGP